MIDPHDMTQQKLVYSRNGTGRWAVLGYCPNPSVTMVNLETGERVNFGLAGSMNGEFEPLSGEVCGPDERRMSALTDTVMLDWLVRNLANVIQDKEGWFLFWPSSMRETDRYPTSRAAITAAMQDKSQC